MTSRHSGYLSGSTGNPIAALLMSASSHRFVDIPDRDRRLITVAI